MSSAIDLRLRLKQSPRRTPTITHSLLALQFAGLATFNLVHTSDLLNLNFEIPITESHSFSERNGYSSHIV